MKLQKYEQKNEEIRLAFETLKEKHPERLRRKIDLSFCTLMFGLEDVPKSIERLALYGLALIHI